jgi:hypothetical protein
MINQKLYQREEKSYPEGKLALIRRGIVQGKSRTQFFKISKK